MRRFFALALIGALAVAASPAEPARAEGVCASSQAANSLMNCAHCKAVKKLLTDAAIHDVDIQVHEMQHGVLVELEGKTPASVRLVKALVDEMWSPAAHCSDTVSELCKARYDQVEKADLDRAITPSGVILVLSSEHEELVTWLREDARTTRNFVMRAAAAD